MVKQIFHLLNLICFIAIFGCETTRPSDGSKPADHEETPGPTSRPNHTSKDSGKKPTKRPPQSELAECRELVKSLNGSLIIAVRVATSKVSGTAVQAMEVKKNGHRAYRVLVQGQSGGPKSVDVDQLMVDAEKLVEPSSPADCKSLYDVTEEKIITAMRLAQTHLKGRLEKAVFEKYDDDYVYAVTVADSNGQYHILRVDADAKKVVKEELIEK